MTVQPIVKTDGGDITIDIYGGLTCSHDGVPASWCDHIREVVEKGWDAQLITPGMDLQVPIIPIEELYASVSLINDPVNWGDSCLMTMVFTPEVGKTVHINLGFWNPGDGNLAVRLVILDWLRSQLHPEENFAPGPIKTKCPSSTHGLQAARKMADNAISANWKFKCLWNIVLEKACTPCIEEADLSSNSALPF